MSELRYAPEKLTEEEYYDLEFRVDAQEDPLVVGAEVLLAGANPHSVLLAHLGSAGVSGLAELIDHTLDQNE